MQYLQVDIITTILFIRKLRQSKAKQIASGHSANMWWSQGSNLSPPGITLIFFLYISQLTSYPCVPRVHVGHKS